MPLKAAKSGDVALAGADGQRAAELLKRSMREGAAILSNLARVAVTRLLERGSNALTAKRLFAEGERRVLAEALAATNGTANLLGRSRVRERLVQALRKHEPEKLAEFPPHVELFEEPKARDLKPMPPEKAVAYFKRLVPTVGVKDPPRFGDLLRREAFTMAVDADAVLLDKVKGVIQTALETGRGVSAAPAQIEELLTGAGVSPRSPQYAEMVFRTNAMDSYNQGTDEEMRDPDVADVFPVWRYLGIRDGRQGKDHEPHFDEYYPSSASFAEVRGDRPFNCRCTAQPIDKWQWKELQGQGATVSAFSEGDSWVSAKIRKLVGEGKPQDQAVAIALSMAREKGYAERPIPDVRQETSYDCGAGALAAALAAFGLPADVGVLATELGTSPSTGTRVRDLAVIAERHGLSAAVSWGMGLRCLQKALDAGGLVLCPVQMHTAGDVTTDRNGHYVLVTGIEDGAVVFHDPMRGGEGGRQTLPWTDWRKGWHDYDTGGRYYYRAGLVLKKVAETFAAGTCKQGQNPKRDGCVAATADAPAAKTSKADQPAKSAARVREEQPSEKAARAKAAHKMVDKEIQRYAEEHNEPHAAKALGGVSFPDSEPMDVAVAGNKKDAASWQREADRWKSEKDAGKNPPGKMNTDGAMAHAIELKTVVDNKNGKITMDSYAQVRKLTAEKERGATFHTVVIDDSKVFNAKGPGQHDESQRRIFYRRGVAGSARYENMHEAKSFDEVKRLMNMPEANLPPEAQRTDGELRKGNWKPFEDANGKGFRDKKTGREIRAKK